MYGAHLAGVPPRSLAPITDARRLSALLSLAALLQENVLRQIDLTGRPQRTTVEGPRAAQNGGSGAAGAAATITLSDKARRYRAAADVREWTGSEALPRIL